VFGKKIHGKNHPGKNHPGKNHPEKTGRITTPKAGTVAYNMQSVISTRLSGA